MRGRKSFLVLFSKEDCFLPAGQLQGSAVLNIGTILVAMLVALFVLSSIQFAANGGPRLPPRRSHPSVPVADYANNYDSCGRQNTVSALRYHSRAARLTLRGARLERSTLHFQFGNHPMSVANGSDDDQIKLPQSICV